MPDAHPYILFGKHICISPSSSSVHLFLFHLRPISNGCSEFTPGSRLPGRLGGPFEVTWIKLTCSQFGYSKINILPTVPLLGLIFPFPLEENQCS